MSRLLVVLISPPEALPFAFDDKLEEKLEYKYGKFDEMEPADLAIFGKKLTELGFKVMEEKCVFYTLMICVVSVAVFSSGFIQKKFFCMLGE